MIQLQGIDEPAISDIQASLRAQLQDADAQLRDHLASWEYAFAMGAGRDGADQHPRHVRARARAAELRGRCRDLRARLAEYDV